MADIPTAGKPSRHPAGGTTDGNRGLPAACPVCNAPALRHDNDDIYCSATGYTYTPAQLAENERS